MKVDNGFTKILRKPLLKLLKAFNNAANKEDQILIDPATNNIKEFGVRR